MKLSERAALSITTAMLSARKSAPTDAKEGAAISGAIGAAAREILATVEAETADLLALLEDLQDRLIAAEQRITQLEQHP